MNYHHFTINERACLTQYIKLGMSYREIAKILNRNVSTISREIKRNSLKYGYNPLIAQDKYDKRRSNCHRNVCLDCKVKEYIEEKLSLTWSPEQIVHYNCDFVLPTVSTIYRWLDQKLIAQGNKQLLRRKNQRIKSKETRGRFNLGRPIRQRDKSILKRKTYGHWEADTVVSSRGNGKSCFVTLVERKSRLFLAKLLPNRTEQEVTKAIIDLLSSFPTPLVKTITCDRGKEFAGYNELEMKLNCKVYFADPYCAWQRGTNENSNGLLREFFPKGMNLDKAKVFELERAIYLINNRPRKINNYIKSVDLFNEQIKLCCT